MFVTLAVNHQTREPIGLVLCLATSEIETLLQSKGFKHILGHTEFGIGSHIYVMHANGQTEVADALHEILGNPEWIEPHPVFPDPSETTS